MTTTSTTMLIVDVLDAEGYETGRDVPVFVDFTTDVDRNYGADADGNRGALLVEYDVLRCWLEEADAARLTEAERKQVCQDAEANFYRHPKHFID